MYPVNNGAACSPQVERWFSLPARPPRHQCLFVPRGILPPTTKRLRQYTDPPAPKGGRILETQGGGPPNNLYRIQVYVYIIICVHNTRPYKPLCVCMYERLPPRGHERHARSRLFRVWVKCRAPHSRAGARPTPTPHHVSTYMLCDVVCTNVHLCNSS